MTATATQCYCDGWHAIEQHICIRTRRAICDALLTRGKDAIMKCPLQRTFILVLVTFCLAGISCEKETEELHVVEVRNIFPFMNQPVAKLDDLLTSPTAGQTVRIGLKFLSPDVRLKPAEFEVEGGSVTFASRDSAIVYFDNDMVEVKPSKELPRKRFSTLGEHNLNIVYLDGKCTLSQLSLWGESGERVDISSYYMFEIEKEVAVDAFVFEVRFSSDFEGLVEGWRIPYYK